MNRQLHVLVPVSLFGLFVAAAVIGPGVAAQGKTGIDAGIAAVGFFFLCAILAFIAGLYALVAAILLRKDLSKGLFLVGTLPLPCLAVTLTVFWIVARDPAPQQPDPPLPTTPTSEAEDF